MTVLRWTPIHGEFEAQAETIVFQGKALQRATDEQAPAEQSTSRLPASVGLCLSDLQTTDGLLSAEITFSTVGPETVCEFVLSYDVETRGMITAGIGGGQSMFAIRRWHPAQEAGEPPRWVALDSSGERANMKTGRAYRVEVETYGSRVRLSVDGAHVAVAQLRDPLPSQGQVGLFCLGYSTTHVRNFQASRESAKAFVVMQFSSPFNEIYTDLIRAACSDHQLDPIRADEMYGPGLIIQDITDQIIRSRVVIADIAPANQSVYFEVGYAHGVRKPLILLAEKGTRLPFDVAGTRTLFYENSIPGRSRFDEGLRKHLSSIVGTPRIPQLHPNK